MHAILKHWHPMAGVDFHIAILPPPAPPVPMTPYKTGFLMLGLGFMSSYSTTHFSQGVGMTMQMGTDIGMMIPHVGPPSTMIPLEIVLSGSKSYFGPANHLADGKPIAAALMVQVNPNLNCGTPMPTPLGFVIAINTHYVSMSFADVFGGFAAMISDWAIQTALFFICGDKGLGRLTNAIGARLSPRVYQHALFRGLMRGDKWASTNAFIRQLNFEHYAPQVLDNAIGFFLGGPLGFDIGTFDVWTPAGAASDASQDGARGLGESAGQALDDYLSSDGVDDYGDSGSDGASELGDYPEPTGDTRPA